MQPTLKELWLLWLKIGFISFGGPAGHISLMFEELVERHRWISPRRFLHALNYCMLLPGPEAMQMATYTGWLMYGVRGGLIAGLMFIMPAVLVLWALSILYVQYGDMAIVIQIFAFLKPAVVAIVILAVIKIAKRSLKGFLEISMALGSFAALFFLKIPFPLVMVMALAVSVGIYLLRKRKIATAEVSTGLQEEAARYFVHDQYESPYAKVSLAGLTGKFLIFGLIWLTAFLVIVALSGDQTFWQTLSLLFSKAALVTFGGAYAVLPYVADVSVQQYGWLSDGQMVDGLALGETTPGPLIMVLAYVGFLAGYHTHEGSMLMGSLALLITVFFTYLPCFFFIFAGAPLIEKTKEVGWIAGILSYLSATVTGVVLNLCTYLVIVILFSTQNGVGFQANGLAIIWTGISLVALRFLHISVANWIGISAALGCSWYFFAG